MLVERELEFEALKGLLKKVVDGRGQIAMVTGEIGIGKSTLLAKFRAHVASNHKNISWISGGCEAMFTPRTLGMLHDMASELGEIVETAIKSGQERSELFGAVLDSLSSNQPIILACEDLHWADHATLDLLKFLSLIHISEPTRPY